MNDTVLRGKRILVVEDDYFIGQDMCGILERAGAVVLGPIGRVGQAARFLRERGRELDGAVLDVDLRGEKSYVLAEMLIRSGQAFIFTTGFGPESIEAAYRTHPWCNKPVSGATLLQALATLLTGSSDADGAA
ncbi:response regulator [Roseomonas sp. M0104]|uniref:Response regulator n=1 Tax=Teichococcus coralli TaxID=2545983 RepID=A0A845BE73_9PROT|nr:response regulator [Pseudoroseomonas coralli]MXP63582.1 response regulator [Pseudoroseomonas coralli]